MNPLGTDAFVLFFYVLVRIYTPLYKLTKF
jgi:hypothetical protein